MWDGWEKAFGGVRVDGATLPGYRRSFSKKSTRNWGTRDVPGPTLGLEPAADAACVGTAFELADAEQSDIVELLRKREGASFSLTELPVRLPEGCQITALTPVDDRNARTYIGTRTLVERAALAKTARGISGACADYVRNIHAKLESLGIVDSDVEELLRLIG
jgi:cation transport protein ChaC